MIYLVRNSKSKSNNDTGELCRSEKKKQRHHLKTFTSTNERRLKLRKGIKFRAKRYKKTCSTKKSSITKQ